jgi:ATP-dependent protease ClpP protease subunit
LQFIYTEPQTELERAIGGFHHINAFGKIDPGDDEKFRKFLVVAAPPPRTTIYINSTGGDVNAAIGIGRLIREGWYETSIGSY